MPKFKNSLYKIIAVLLVLLLTLCLCGCKSRKKEYTKEISVNGTASDVVYELKNESEPSVLYEESPQSTVSASASKSNKAAAGSVKNKKSSQTTPKSPVKQADSSNEMRAVWISYLEFQSILKNKTAAVFTSTINSYFDKCVAAGMNAVVVQIRSHGDAYYPSTIFPTSANFTGTRQVHAPFDPVAIMINSAHARGLKFHAWINPFRGPKTTDILSPNDLFGPLIGTGRVFDYNGYYYLDPGFAENREIVLSGIREVATNYAIDGLHFDDWFYPTGLNTIDTASYSMFGRGRTLSQYRLDNINDLMRNAYATLKSIRNVPLGISPQGNISSCYATNFTDVNTWGKTTGYCDYIAPQLYWALGEGTLPYEKALANWKAVVTNSNIKLVIGLAPYKVGTNAFWSGGDVLKQEVQSARAVSNYSGFILFRYEQFFSAACNTERDNLHSILQ